MDINFSDVVRDRSGKIIFHEGVPLTLGAASAHAVITFPEPGLSLRAAMDRSILATRLRKEGEQDVTPGEVDLIKARVPHTWATGIADRVVEMLD